MIKENNNMIFNNYMQIAINEAKKNIKDGLDKEKQEIPIGCVIIDNETGKIIAKSCNTTVKNKNPLQHSEIVCINKAFKVLKTNQLNNYSMFITLEPCIMCAGAIMLSKIGKIYIGCQSEKTGAIINNFKIFDKKNINHKPEIYFPIMEKECKKLIQDFFIKRRQQIIIKY